MHRSDFMRLIRRIPAIRLESVSFRSHRDILERLMVVQTRCGLASDWVIEEFEWVLQKSAW